MQKLLSIRLPLAWFLMFTIVISGAGIMLILITQAATPSNAVLIESLEDMDETTNSTPDASAKPIVSPTLSTSAASATLPTSTILSIYVSGAVESPGVYTLPTGSRVDDALKAAGGASSQADLEQINLAAYVSDQEHVRVPKIGDPTIVAGLTPSPRSQGTNSSTAQPGSKPPGEILNLNSATALELETLPGIGPVLAARIVADRDAHGSFRSVDDLMRVAGIKEGLLSSFREYVTVSP